MSAISFRPSVVAPLNLPSIEPSSKSQLAFELQKAFYEFDLEKVSCLIEKGANPNQEIEITNPFLCDLEVSCFNAYLFDFGYFDRDISEIKSELEEGFTLVELEVVLKVKSLSRRNAIKTMWQYYRVSDLDFDDFDILNSYKQFFGNPPAFFIAVMLGDFPLVRDMIANGANVHNFSFCPTKVVGGIEKSANSLDIFLETKMQMTKFLLEAGCPFDQLVKVDYDFIEDLVMTGPENFDEILTFLSAHFDYKKLLKENDDGETEFIRIVKFLIKRHNGCNLKILTNLVEHLPNSAQQHLQDQIEGYLGFSGGLSTA